MQKVSLSGSDPGRGDVFLRSRKTRTSVHHSMQRHGPFVPTEPTPSLTDPTLPDPPLPDLWSSLELRPCSSCSCRG